MYGVDAGGPVPFLQCLQNFKTKRDKDGNKQLHTPSLLLFQNCCKTMSHGKKKGNHDLSRVCGVRVCIYTCCGSKCTLNCHGVNEIPQTHLLSSSNSDRT